MNTEYRNGDLILKVLGEGHSQEVLEFYERNREQFDVYETDKPEQFYTLPFIHNLMHAERKGYLSKKYVRFFLYAPEQYDSIIGTVSFSNIQRGFPNSCIIGYKIDGSCQHLGLGRQMVRMALSIIIEEYGMHRIEAYIAPDNTPSLALVHSLGFKSEGTAYAYVKLHGAWQDHLRYVYIS